MHVFFEVDIESSITGSGGESVSFAVVAFCAWIVRTYLNVSSSPKYMHFIVPGA